MTLWEAEAPAMRSVAVAVRLITLHWLFFAFLGALSACQSGEKALPMNQASALVNGEIKIGMKRADVVGRLGEPSRVEKNGATEFLFYRTPWMMNWSIVGSNPIAILDDKVVGMGSAFYSDNHAQIPN